MHGGNVVQRASLSISVFVIMATFGHAPADDRVSKKSPETLIGELGDSDFNRREAATKAIEALGAAALPALHKAAKHPDAEIRSSVNKSIPLAVVAPKRVSLDLSGMPIHRAIDALLKEAGYKLDFDHSKAPYQKPCDIKLRNVTIWEGLERICSQGQISPCLEEGSGGKTNLFYCEPGRRPSICHGAFRLSADGFMPIHAFGDAPNFLVLHVSVVAEPRLKLVSAVPEIAEAKDNRDRSLIYDDKRNDDPIRGNGDLVPRFMDSRPCGNIAQAWTGLSWPEKNAKTVKAISGSMTVTIEQSRRSLVVSDDIWQAKGREIHVGHGKLHITDFFKTPGKDEYKVCMTVDKPSVSEIAVIVNQELASFDLQDPTGVSYEQTGSGGSFDSDNPLITLEFHYASRHTKVTGAPKKLVYIRRDCVTYHIPFEFKGLPLPHVSQK
jgi:hypothetical protein